MEYSAVQPAAMEQFVAFRGMAVQFVRHLLNVESHQQAWSAVALPQVSAVEYMGHRGLHVLCSHWQSYGGQTPVCENTEPHFMTQR